MTAIAPTSITAPGGRQPANADLAARLVNASKIYGSGDSEVRALDDVTVGFRSGQFTAIMGPSGSGKSTLMQNAAGLDQLTSGSAYIGDTDLSTLSDRDLTLMRRAHIGFIFQSFNLIPTLSAEENITLPLALDKRRPNPETFDRVIDVLGIRERLDHRPNELSGGQQQRVAVARALVAEPSIVFGDEPTGNLDSRTGAEILEFMQRAVQEIGQTIVMVTHDPGAAAYADRVVFVNDGQIVDEMLEPTRDRVFDRMKAFGR